MYMPIYEYECESCKNRFEIRQHMIDAPLTECPSCRKHVRRVLSGGIGIEFRGSGFYVNDAHAASCTAKKTGESCCKTGSCNKCGA